MGCRIRSSSHGLVFNPAFLRDQPAKPAVRRFFSPTAARGSTLSYRLRPARKVVETQLTIDGQVALFRSDGRLADFPLAGGNINLALC